MTNAEARFNNSHIRKVYACLAVTCHLHFWQNDRDFLRATVVTRGWNGYRNKSQHRKSTLEKKILPPFQQGFEPATFQSRVRRSNHWAIPAPSVGWLLTWLYNHQKLGAGRVAGGGLNTDWCVKKNSLRLRLESGGSRPQQILTKQIIIQGRLHLAHISLSLGLCLLKHRPSSFGCSSSPPPLGGLPSKHRLVGIGPDYLGNRLPLGNRSHT